MPTKINGSGEQQEYDATTGRYGGASSGKHNEERKPQQAPKKIEDIEKVYEQLSDKERSMHDEYGQVGNAIRRYKKGAALIIMRALDNPEDILFLDKYDIYNSYPDGNINDRRGDAELKERLEGKKKQFEEAKAEREEDHKVREKEAEEYKSRREKAIRDGVTDAQFKREEEASSARLAQERKERTISIELKQAKQHGDGYVDSMGKSVRAVQAELDHKFPASIAAKLLGVSQKKIQDTLYPHEWHHSGGDMYNKVPYYDISKLWDIADAGIDYYADDEDYAEAIEQYKKMTGRK